MGMYICMPRLKSRKKRDLEIKSEKMQEKIGIQMTFTLEIKLQKFIF